MPTPTGLMDVSLEPTPAIEAYKRDVDRTLFRENLKLTVQQRMDNMVSVLAFTEELQRSGREASKP